MLLKVSIKVLDGARVVCFGPFKSFIGIPFPKPQLIKRKFVRFRFTVASKVIPPPVSKQYLCVPKSILNAPE